MRISKEALLIVLAFTVPFVVEFRTVLAWFNVELTVFESLLLGAALIVAILVWALFPQDSSRDTDASGSS